MDKKFKSAGGFFRLHVFSKTVLLSVLLGFCLILQFQVESPSTVHFDSEAISILELTDVAENEGLIPDDLDTPTKFVSLLTSRANSLRPAQAPVYRQPELSIFLVPPLV